MRGQLGTFLLASAPLKSNSDLGSAVSGGTSYGFGDLGAVFDKQIETWKFMDSGLIKAYASLPLIAVAICVIILIILCLLILRIHGLGNGIRFSAIDSELSNFQRLQRHDRSIIRRKKFMTKLVKAVNNVGLGMSEAREEYIGYNLKRAGIMGPSETQVMTPAEYNALIKLVQCIILAVSLVMCLRSTMIGLMVAFLGIMVVGKAPEMIIRGTVIQKDKAINKGFFSFYGNIHYNIIRASPTPIKVEVRNYATRDLSPEMAEFVNNVADTFDLYGEYVGSKYIASDYRELPNVGKLMRLIQQYYDGGDVVNDMIGFRQSLMLEKQMAVDEEGERVAEKCRRALIIVFIVLIQVVISTLANTLPDIMNFGSMI